MFKKYLSYSVLLIIFLCVIILIIFGGLLRHHYLGGHKLKTLQNFAVFISEIPMILNNMYVSKSLNPNKHPVLTKHKKKKRFERFIYYNRDALLVLPRYDHSLNRSVVDIIDLQNFKIIHTYIHDIIKMNNQVKNTEEFPRIKIDDQPIRFEYRHPLLLIDGSLISDSEYSPEFKVDFCSNLMWVNDEEIFHHSKMLDHEENIWVAGQMNPKSQYVKKYLLKNYADDAIIKMNSNGKIIYKKSVTEILIENNIVTNNFAFNAYLNKNFDPIHLNDIEPSLRDTKYWKKGDVFLSLRHQSAIVHYRPSNNKIINYITGPFYQQHDVDIISDEEISIFNNNNSLVDNSFSEVLIYNFKRKEFKKLFNDQLKKNDFKTITQGLSHIFKDGSLLVEEQNHGRILLFNNRGKKEWEFINKDKNGDIGLISWSRVIEDKVFIEQFKNLVKNKKCIN